MTLSTDLRTLLRTELTRAMKHHDRLAAGALRSAIGAIDNAEALPPRESVAPAGEGPIAGAAVGLGATEAARRDLTPQDVHEVLEAEVAERREAADEMQGAGRPDRAADLRREADLLESVLRSS
jgi:hypothetical protein